MTTGYVWIIEDPRATPVLLFLVQLFLTLVVTRVLGKLFSYLKQPQVIGEIIGGIVLGASVLGRFESYRNAVWPTAAQISGMKYPYNSVLTFTVIANLGLILFMFLLGMELDRRHFKQKAKTSFAIALSAILIPFGIGIAAGVWLDDVNAEKQAAGWQQPRKLAFILFMGSSMAFTAFPVLSAILQSANLIHTELGVQALACAAIDDVLAWLNLALASAFAKSGSVVNGAYTCLLTLAYIIAMLFVVAPIMACFHSMAIKRGWHKSRYYVCYIFLMLIASAFTTEMIGIHAFFGAFLMGLLVPKEEDFVAVLCERCELVVAEVLLPLYFVSSGIRTDISTLNTARSWGITLAIICIACAAKFVPACITTRVFARKPWRFCVSIGLLMNTRGLVEVIALNIGLSLGLLSVQLFSMLIIMAIATTVLTSPLLWLVYMRHMDEHGELAAPKTSTDVEQLSDVEQGKDGTGDSEGASCSTDAQQGVQQVQPVANVV